MNRWMTAVIFLGVTTCHAQPPAEVDIPFIPTSPTVDGALSPGEYAKAFSINIDGTTPNQNPGWNPYNGTTPSFDSIHFTAYVAHDGEALYVAYDIFDNTISSTHFPNQNMGSQNIWEDDCTEIFIDCDLDRDNPSEGAAAAQSTTDRSWNEGQIPHYAVPNGTYWDDGHGTYGPTGVWYARTTVISATHYQTEYRFPFANMDTADGAATTRAAKVGDTIGLNIMVNDVDGGNRVQVAWRGISHDDQLYRQQNAWVPVKLAAKNDEAWSVK